MCLAIPMKLVAINGFSGKVIEGGVQRDVRLDLMEAPQLGQYVIVHAGYAIQVLDAKEAEETLELIAGVQAACTEAEASQAAELSLDNPQVVGSQITVGKRNE